MVWSPNFIDAEGGKSFEVNAAEAEEDQDGGDEGPREKWRRVIATFAVSLKAN